MAKTGDQEFSTEIEESSKLVPPSEIVNTKKPGRLQYDPHATMFESQLLVLFSLIGTKNKIQFKMRSEIEGVGKSFNDLIFAYEDETKHWSYRYMQVKHHKHSRSFKITPDHLLADDGGDFSLLKYIRLFSDTKKPKEFTTDPTEFLICTNADISNTKENKWIEMEKVETIDIFGNEGECYKIKFTSIQKISEILKKPDDDFVKDAEIFNFLSKLIFVVKIPDRIELSQILAAELNKHYPDVQEMDLQSSYILKSILESFKEESASWYSSIKIQEIPRVIIEYDSFRAAALSIDYQTQLSEVVQFNENAVQVMAKKLKSIFCSPVSKKITHIATTSPIFTAIKVIRALKHEIISTLEKFNFECDGSYLVTSSSRLRRGCGKRWMKNWLLHDGNPQQQLLIIICDDDANIQIIEPTSEICDSSGNTMFILKQEESELLESKNFIVIENELAGHTYEHEDAVTYGHLDDVCKTTLGSRIVSFQGKDKTVTDLFVETDDMDSIEPKDFRLMFEELTLNEKPVIPSFNSPQFEQQYYMKRQLSFPSVSDQQVLGDKPSEKYRINVDGSIEWLVEKNRRLQVWNEMKETFEDSKLIDQAGEGRVVIITGEAGTGKSTILSYIYEEIKARHPEHWVIKLNLSDHSGALSEYDNVISFFNDSSVVINHSSFAQALLINRLTEKGGVVVMLDGFDEIKSRYRENAIKLIKAVMNQTYVNQLYVTARNDELQDRLFQFAYCLEHPTEDNQINYLTSFLKTHPKLLKDQNPQKIEEIQNFAHQVIALVSTSLNDIERGITPPAMQCRILLEYFWEQISNSSFEKLLFVGLRHTLEEKNFGLAKLYEHLLEAKRQAFIRKKQDSLGSVYNQLIVDLEIKASMLNIMSYLRRLAIETLLPEKATMEILWPPVRSADPKATREEQERITIENVLQFGLTFVDNERNSLQFLNRTCAEYLVAEYLYQKFYLDDDRHNIEYEPVHKFIAEEIEVKNQYKGVRVFLKAMLGETDSIPYENRQHDLMEMSSNSTTTGQNCDNGALENERAADETTQTSPTGEDSDKEYRPLYDTPNDDGHDNRFQLKLLLLVIVRAINNGYEKFLVGTKSEEFAGKFDDLVFVKENNSTKSYLYLQAKHKMCEKPHANAKKITAADILNDDKGDFSLLKYFDSYRNQIVTEEKSPKNDDHVDCFILTNISFDYENLKKNGIKLGPIAKDPDNSIPPRDLLTFDTSIQYRIESIDWIRFVANVLCANRCVEPEFKPESKLDQQGRVFKSYLFALFDENVVRKLSLNKEKKKGTINCTTIEFHPDFTEEKGNRTNGAIKLRNILTEIMQNSNNWKHWKFSITTNVFVVLTKGSGLIPGVLNKGLDDQFGSENNLNEFLKIFVFAANIPNENKLGEIINREFDQLFHTDLQFDYFSNEISNFFKKEENKWLSVIDGKKNFLGKTNEKMVLEKVVGFSTNYRKQLKEIYDFNKQANEYKLLAPQLNSFLKPKTKDRVLFIKTPAPELTAIKVMEALEHDTHFKLQDRCLFTSSTNLKKGHEKEWILAMLIKGNMSRQLLVVVCDDNDTIDTVKVVGESSTDEIAYLFNQNEWQSITETRKVIVITKARSPLLNAKFLTSRLIEDTIGPTPRHYDKLSKKFLGETEGKLDQHFSSGIEKKTLKMDSTVMTTPVNQQEHLIGLPSKPNDQLFGGNQLRCLNQVFLSKSGYGTAYRGFWKDKEVAVRRIKTIDCPENWKNIVDKHLNGKLIHENVLKIIGLEDDQVDQSRYFALELYAATLEQFCTGEYTGPMPSEAQVLNQIAKGVNYLHENGLVHGNLNPQTILVSQSQPVRIKVSEFGLCKHYERDGGVDETKLPSESLVSSYLRFGLEIFWFFTGNVIERSRAVLFGDEAQEPTRANSQSEQLKFAQGIRLSHPKYWTRAKYESLSVNQEGKRSIPPATVNGDIFATGCLLFYYLKRGLHPFGDSKSIVANISKKKPVNLEELDSDHIAFDWIKNLIGDPPTDGINYVKRFASHLKDLLPLKIDGKELGRGGFGIVFAGTFQGKKVAVKRISVADTEPDAIKIEVEEHNRLDHDNVLKLLHEEMDSRFKYLVLELCAGTLTNYCENNYKGPKLPRDEVVLFQIAMGLDYIHSRKLVHRDVKPDNILISITSPVQMKLSDFGLCKKVSPRGTFAQSGLRGTTNWMAPELLENFDVSPDDLPRGTIESDIFAAGCVFFYFLTRGSHPFGNPTFVPANICNYNPVLLNEGNLLPADNLRHAMPALVGDMIKKLDERTKLREVIEKLAPFLPQPSTIKFKKVTRTLPTTITNPYVRSCFHPIDPVLACGLSDGQVILFESTSRLLPFSYWRENKEKFTHYLVGKEVTVLNWNVNGTQLAAGFKDGTVITWSYPSGQVLFQMKKHSYLVWLFVWNPFRQDVLATRDVDHRKLLFWHTQGNGDAGKANHFLTVERDVDNWPVAWISENHVALGLENGWIEIFQTDDIKGKTTTERIIKRFKHCEDWIRDLQWNETTGYLAACSWGGLIKIWSMDSDQPVYSLKMDSPCWRLTWRRKGKTWSSDGGIDAARKSKENLEIVCGLDDGSIVIWNPLEEDEANRTRNLPQTHSDLVVSLSFSPNGRFLASADYKKELIIWSTETWQPVYTCENTVVNLSWLSMDSSSFPVYKLNGHSRNELYVIEQAVTE